MKNIILLFLVFSSIVIFANDYEIAPQRMITDYNGIAYNKDIILCYGNYGIITFTTDEGKTWDRINIGDKHRIKKIITVNNEFYGVSDFSILHSKNGINWNVKELSESQIFISILFTNDKLYYLANDGIYSSNLDLQINKVYDLNKIDNNYTEFQTDNENLYFIKNTYDFAVYNITNNEYITYDNVLYIDKNNEFPYSRNLKIINDKLIVQPTRSNQSSNILVSNNKGKDWEKIYDFHNNFSTYCLNGNNLELFFLRYTFINDIYPDIKPSGYYAIISPTLIEYSLSSKTEQIVTDTSEIKDKDSLLLTSFPISEPITHLEKVSDETYVATGKNMSIFISNDGGINWKIKSNFAQYMYYNYNYKTRFYKPIILDKNKMIFNYFSGIIHNTYNAGITWLPQKIKINDVTKLSGSPLSQYYFNNNNGILFFGDTNFVTTNDYAKSLNYSEPIKNLGINSIGRTTSNYKGVEVNDNILFVSQYYYKNPRSKILVFDNSYNLKDTVVFDSTIVKQIFKDDINNLYSLCYKKSIKEADFENNINIDYFMIKSTDNGNSWKKMNIEVPMKSGKKYIEENDSFVEIDSYKAQYKYKNNILFPNTWDSTNVMYIFNFNTEKFDTVYLPAELNRVNVYDNMFEHRNRLYFVSTDAVMYFAENLGLDNVSWDSIDVKKYFYNWKKREDNGATFNAIYSVYSFDEQLYFTITSMPQTYYNLDPFHIQLNLVKFYKDDFISNVEETETQNYLYTYPPYPQPASTEVRSLVYWDTSLEMNTKSVKIYNTNGVEVGREQDISFEQINAYSGNLIWNCTNVPDGVYLIQISHGDKKQTIKVMVRK